MAKMLGGISTRGYSVGSEPSASTLARTLRSTNSIESMISIRPNPQP
jgi:hypothetical protein